MDKLVVQKYFTCIHKFWYVYSNIDSDRTRRN